MWNQVVTKYFLTCARVYFKIWLFIETGRGPLELFLNGKLSMMPSFFLYTNAKLMHAKAALFFLRDAAEVCDLLRQPVWAAFLHFSPFHVPKFKEVL